MAGGIYFFLHISVGTRYNDVVAQGSFTSPSGLMKFILYSLSYGGNIKEIVLGVNEQPIGRQVTAKHAEVAEALRLSVMVICVD
jgi:hypothetical protein